MIRSNSSTHTQQIDAWIRQNLQDLPADQISPIFCAVTQALLNRALVTLSEVTLNAVVDRVLHQSRQKHPGLARLKCENFRPSFDLSTDSLQDDPTKITEGYRFFLIELLTILGNLTGGIISEPLHQELSKINTKNYLTSTSDRGDL